MRGCRTSNYNYETGLAASVSTSEAGVICCSQLSRHKCRTCTSQTALTAGKNDATVILKPTPGSKRTRYVRDLQAAAYLGNLHTDSNYTIILGSHRNSCLKFEKDLQPRHQASTTLWPVVFGCTHSTHTCRHLKTCSALLDQSLTAVPPVFAWSGHSIWFGVGRWRAWLQVDRGQFHPLLDQLQPRHYHCGLRGARNRQPSLQLD